MTSIARLDLPLKIAIRPATKDDHNFVFGTWRGSFRASRGRNWRQGSYNIYMSDRMCRILERAQVCIACFPEHPEDMIGWIAAEPPLLHYCFVKSVYQRQKVATRLIEHLDFPKNFGIFCTHWTPNWNAFAKASKVKIVNCEV